MLWFCIWCSFDIFFSSVDDKLNFGLSIDKDRILHTGLSYLN